MEHAGARDAYTHAYVYIYTLFIFYYPSLTRPSCLVSRIQILPIVRRCIFVRHASRVEDLPSRSRKGDHCSAGRWFLDLKKDPGRA